jgi:hypothetical protein
MIGVLYGFLAVALGFLFLDVSGRLRVDQRRAWWWHRLGIVAAAGPGLGPIVSLVSGSLVAAWPFPMIAAAYLGLFLAYAAGVSGWPGGAAGLGLRRSAYLGLILLAALPSMVLLLLTPFVAIAGLGLARARVPMPSNDPAGPIHPAEPAEGPEPADGPEPVDRAESADPAEPADAP